MVHYYKEKVRKGQACSHLLSVCIIIYLCVGSLQSGLCHLSFSLLNTQVRELKVLLQQNHSHFEDEVRDEGDIHMAFYKKLKLNRDKERKWVNTTYHTHHHIGFIQNKVFKSAKCV